MKTKIFACFIKCKASVLILFLILTVIRVYGYDFPRYNSDEYLSKSSVTFQLGTPFAEAAKLPSEETYSQINSLPGISQSRLFQIGTLALGVDDEIEIGGVDLDDPEETPLADGLLLLLVFSMVYSIYFILTKRKI